MSLPLINLKPIYEFDSYRAFVDHIVSHANARGVSIRSVARQCGLSNANLFKQLINRERRLTLEAAQKIANGLDLDTYECQYFFCLVQHEREPSDDVLARLNNLRRIGLATWVKDGEKNGHWLYGVLREMTNLEGQDFSVDHLHARLAHLSSSQEIEEALDFLIRKSWIERCDEGNGYQQTKLRPKTVDDTRQVMLQKIHSFYLNIARHRLGDKLDEREFQGYTVAIPKSKMPWIKQRLRKFYDELELELDSIPDCDIVVRIQTAVFNILLDK